MEVTLPIAEDHLKGYLNEFVKAKMNAKDRIRIHTNIVKRPQLNKPSEKSRDNPLLLSITGNMKTLESVIFQ